MSSKKNSFSKKCQNKLKQFKQILTSFIDGLAKDTGFQEYKTVSTKITNKSITRELMETTRFINRNMRKTLHKVNQNPTLKNVMDQTKQTSDFQASKRRLISRMISLQAKINQANRQRSE